MMSQAHFSETKNGSTPKFQRLLRGNIFKILIFLGLLNTVQALEKEARLNVIRENFRPGKPAVHMGYAVNYCLLGLELKHLAQADVIAVEGDWYSQATGKYEPACLVEFTLKTGTDPSLDKGFIQIHDRVTAVLTMPDLNAIIFAKCSMQRINLLCRHKKIDNMEIYNLESGNLAYTGYDFLQNTVSTNLVGSEELVKQGKEVSRFLQIIYHNYQNEEALKGFDSDSPVYIYTEGDLVPFTLRFKPKREKVSVLGSNLPSLFFTAKPHRNAGGRGRNFAMWAISFPDISQKIQKPDLIDLAYNTLPWSMIPLRTELGLPLGSIRCFLTDIQAVPWELVRVTGSEAKPELLTSN